MRIRNPAVKCDRLAGWFENLADQQLGDSVREFFL